MSMLREEVVTLGDMPLRFVAEINSAVQIGAVKAGHNRVTTRRR